MPTRHAFARTLLGLCLLGLGLLSGPPAWSQSRNPAATAPASTPAPTKLSLPAGSAFSLSGTTLQGQPFNLANQRGKVVLVYFWDTNCAVCLDKMPELRANADGWRGKPFSIINVQLDKQPQAALRYWQAVGMTHSVMGTVLWQGESGYRDSLPQRPATLPFSVLLDAQGKVVTTFEGRIPPQAWDQVAELLL
jgi:thiol-disulfide isomerase/thioredoxin